MSTSDDGRRGRIFLALLGLAAALALALAVAGAAAGRGADRRVDRALAAELRLTGLALWSEASYCRHPSQADLFAPHADHPGAFERFPAGSIVPPRPSLGLDPVSHRAVGGCPNGGHTPCAPTDRLLPAPAYRSLTIVDARRDLTRSPNPQPEDRGGARLEGAEARPTDSPGRSHVPEWRRAEERSPGGGRRASEATARRDPTRSGPEAFAGETGGPL